MFCQKCGKELEEDAKACAFCGAMVDGSANPFIDSGYDATSDRAYSKGVKPVSSYRPKPAKKRKTGLIIGIIAIVLVLLGGAAFGHYYCHRPIVLITKAIEANDIKTVASLYGELTKDEDREFVQKAMASYCSSLERDFLSKDKDYDEVSADLKLLGKEILKDNSRFTSVSKNIEVVNASREAYDAAIEAFDKEDYEKASELFESVAKKDEEHFDDAQEKIEEIKKLLIPDVMGSWRATVDFAPAIIDSMNLSSYNIDSSVLSKVSLPIDVLMIFGDDDTVTIMPDQNTARETLDKFVDDVLDIAVIVASSAAGMSAEDLEKYCQLLYGTDVKTAIMKELGASDLSEEVFKQLSGIVESYYYTVEEDKVYLYGTSSDFESGNDRAIGSLHLYDNKLLLDDDTINIDHSLKLCVEFPLEFIKDEK